MYKGLEGKCYPHDIEKEYCGIAEGYVDLLHEAMQAYMPTIKRAQARLENIQPAAARRLARKTEAKRIARSIRNEFERAEKAYKLDEKVKAIAGKLDAFQAEATEAILHEAVKAADKASKAEKKTEKKRV